MANQALRTALDSDDGADVYGAREDLLIIAEENPKHPNHADHMLRVDPRDPDNIALLASLREHGWVRTETISAWKDGKGDRARYVLSNGRRRLTFVRVENERRKREKDKRGPIRPRVVLGDEPLLTETVANSMGKRDPPMVLGKRFRDLSRTLATQHGATKGASMAAAALGLSLAEANNLTTIAAIPSPDLHEAVNARQIPIDVAARAAKNGTQAVGKVLADARDPGTGKVTPGRAKAAAKANHTPRPRGLNRDEIAYLALVVKERATWTGEQVAELLAYTTTGAQRGEDAPPMSTAVAKATAAAETAAKEARKAAKGGAP